MAARTARRPIASSTARAFSALRAASVAAARAAAAAALAATMAALLAPMIAFLSRAMRPAVTKLETTAPRVATIAVAQRRRILESFIAATPGPRPPGRGGLAARAARGETGETVGERGEAELRERLVDAGGVEMAVEKMRAGARA